MNFFVYAIQSKKAERIYIGQIADFASCFEQHNLGRTVSTKDDAPWKPLQIKFFPTREAARFFEWQLKKSRGKNLKWLVS